MDHLVTPQGGLDRPDHCGPVPGDRWRVAQLVQYFCFVHATWTTEYSGQTSARKAYVLRRFFEEEAFRKERRRHVLDVLVGDAARAEMVPPSLHDGNDILDLLPR